MRPSPRVTAVVATLVLALAGAACTDTTTEPAPQVATAEQTTDLAFGPAPVAQSGGVADLTPATVQVSPAVEGQEVVLQRASGGSWEEAATAPQDADGVATFAVDVPPGPPQRFRSVILDAEGTPAALSPRVRVKTPQPMWSDEFDGTELDPEKWSHRQLGTRNPAGGRPCAEGAESAVTVADGSVQMLVSEIPEDKALASDEPQDCPLGEFYNGHIGTRGNFSFRYGTMAARIRFPSQMGQHGAFWSQPNKWGSGPEIDTVEYFGDEFPVKGEMAGVGAVQHSIYWPQEDGTTGKVGGLFDLSHLLEPDEKWSEDFHVYSVEWTPTEYIFRVDGHETFRTSEGLSDVKQYLILSLLTSDWELARLVPSNLTPMFVDWVRVWKMPKGA